MTHRLGMLWIALRTSLWFVPALIVTSLVLLAIVLIEVDGRLEPDVFDAWPRLFGAGAEGTRGMLSTIATAMITVAGVVFSITIVALSLTSTQYTSRVLRKFMGDRPSQVVLGAFVGIYAYCLIVLRTIRGPDEGAFVPSLAAIGAIALAFVGIGLLIHFIHHISSSIQAAHILAAIREETSASIDRLFPEPLGVEQDAPDVTTSSGASPVPRWTAVHATRTGYIQSVDGDGLIGLACANDLLIRLPHCIGDFIIEGLPIAQLSGEPANRDALADKVRGAFTVEDQRTVEQDAGYGFRQIVDIALKALSPSTNDPTTATMCLDHLSALLVQLASRRMPTTDRYAQGRLRLISQRATFESLLALAIEEIRLAAADQPVVLRRVLEVLETVARAADSRRRPAVVRHVTRCAASIGALRDAASRNELAAVAAGVLQELGDPAAHGGS